MTGNTAPSPIGYVTKEDLANLRCGVSCVDLFGSVVPKGAEMIPVYASPPPLPQMRVTDEMLSAARAEMELAGYFAPSAEIWNRAFRAMVHAQPAPAEHVLPGDAMLNIAKLAGQYDIRYPTNAAMQAFLGRLLSDFRSEWEKHSAPPTDQLRAGNDAERLEDLRLAATAIRTYMPDTLPAGEDGKIHFARALAEAAADAIEAYLYPRATATTSEGGE